MVSRSEPLTEHKTNTSRCLGQPLGLLAYHKILWVRDLQKTQILHDTDILRKHLACTFLIQMTNSTHHGNCQNDFFFLISYCTEYKTELSLSTLLTQTEVQGVNSTSLIVPSAKLTEVVFCE